MHKKKIIEFTRTDLVKAPIASSIRDIAKIMQGGIIGSVFLTDDDGKIKGMITDKAIFDLIVVGKNPLETKPADLMESIELVRQDTPALDVLALMEDKKITRVGVADMSGQMIGIVSRKKIKFEQLHILKEELGIQD